MRCFQKKFEFFYFIYYLFAGNLCVCVPFPTRANEAMRFITWPMFPVIFQRGSATMAARIVYNRCLSGRSVHTNTRRS